MRIRSLIAIALAPVLLAGCDGADAPTGDDERTASGQVLEGSVSDAMIPLEQVKSQPPLARDRPAGESGDDEDEGEGDASANEAATDAGPGENPLYQDGFDG